jgi:hypothetical protein
MHVNNAWLLNAFDIFKMVFNMLFLGLVRKSATNKESLEKTFKHSL